MVADTRAHARSALFALLSWLVPGSAPAGETGSFTLLGSFADRGGVSAVAGLVSQSKEMAVAGTSAGTVLVDATDPGAPVETGFIAGTSSSARSVAVYGTVAYVASADGGGLQVIDLSIPTSPTLATTRSEFTSASDLFADPATDVLFVAGTPGGLHIYDLTDPLDPVPALPAPFADFPIRRIHARGPLAYAATGPALAILDVSFLPNVRLVAWVTYPGVTSSGVWADVARRLAVVADDGALEPGLRVVEVFNPVRMRVVGAHAHTPNPAARARNVRLVDSMAFVAFGTDGLAAVDVTDPTAPLAAGTFAPAPRPGARGVAEIVAVDPFAPSGTIYAADATDGLSFLSHDPGTGTLGGKLTDSSTGAAAPAVLVTVEGAGRRVVTGNDGLYRVRLAPGTYEVSFDRYVFFDDSLEVTIQAGIETVVDRTLIRRPAGTIRGQVTLAAPRGSPAIARHPEGTIVSVLGTPIQFPSGFSGFYTIIGVPTGTYVVEADRFGFDPKQIVVDVLEDGDHVHDLLLEPAIYWDDLEADLGWTAGAPGDGATSGAWIRDIPVGTAAGYVQTGRDETPDPAEIAFVTGNGPEGAFIDVADVDGGTTTAIGPVLDLSTLGLPILRYFRWFTNDAAWAGESFDGDTFALDVSNDGGATWTNLETLSRSALFWPQADFVLRDHLPVTSEMRFRVVVTDAGAPSIVEAAFDDLEVFEGADLLVLPPTPIRFASVVASSPAPGVVRIVWEANGAYEAFRIERARGDGARRRVGETLGGAPDGRYAFVDRSAPRGELARYWLVGFLSGGGREEAGPFPVAVRGGGARARVLGAFPTPTGGATRLAFEVPSAGRARLAVFDAAGRRVATLLERTIEAGAHVVVWDGADAQGRALPAGVYWYRLDAGETSAAGRIVRVR